MLIEQTLTQGMQKLLTCQTAEGYFSSPIQSRPGPILIEKEFSRITGGTERRTLKTVLFSLGIKESSPLFDDHFSAYQELLDATHTNVSLVKLSNSLFDQARQFCDPYLWNLALALDRSNRRATTHQFRRIDLWTWNTIVAIEACALAGETQTAEKAVRWLLAHQEADGSWSCSPHYGQSDSDTSAAAIEMLADFVDLPGVTGAAERGFAWLKLLDLPDGSSKTFPHSHGLPCPEVTAQVAVARRRWGVPITEMTLRYLEDHAQQPSYLYRDHGRIYRLLRKLDLVVQENELQTIEGRAMSGKISCQALAQLQRSSGWWPASYYTRYLGNIFLWNPCWSQAILLTCFQELQTSEWRNHVHRSL